MGLILFIPFVVSLVLMMGYDKIVAAFVTVGSMAAGLIGTTYASSNISMLTTSLNLDFDYEIGVRFVLLLVGIILVIFNTLMYIKKYMVNVKIEKKTIKKSEEKAEEIVEEKKAEKTVAKSNNSSKTKSSSSKKTNSSKKSSSTKSSKSRKSDNKAALKDEDIIVVKETAYDDEVFIPESVNSKHSVWPFAAGFILLLVIMVLAFISWGDTGFNVKIFDDATKAVKLLGTVNSFGNWNLIDLFLPIVSVMLLLCVIYKVNINDMFDGFAEGAKKALYPAFISILVYTVLVLTTYHPFQLVIYKAVLGMTKGFNIATTSIVAILAGLFNVDAAYVFQSSVPYFASVVTNADNYSIAGIIFQAMYGLVVLVAPTSLILMGILSYLKVSYGEWLKRIWKLLLELFVVLLIVFMILAVI